MRLATLAALTACLFGAVIVSAQETEENEYNFSYQTDSSFRKEKKGADGTILGEYGFRTPDGCMHVVKYRAHTKGGYRILGSSKRDCIKKTLRQRTKVKSPRPTSRTTTTRAPPLITTKAPPTTTRRIPRTRAPRTKRPRTTTTTERPIQVSIPRPAPRILEPVNNAIDGPSTTTVYPVTRNPGSSSRIPSPSTTSSPSVPSIPTSVTTTRRTTTTTTTTPRPRPTTPKTKTTTPKRPTFAKSLSKDEPEPSYTFGFTTSTHGHTESGLPDGSKKGEYFIDYPDGWRRIVTYVANERGFFPKMRRVRIPTTTVAPPTTTPGEDEEGDSIGKELGDVIPTVPSGGFGCPYYFYYNTKINYHWEYCQLNGTKVGEFGELASDNYVHVNAYYADARGFHPKLSKTLMTPEQREVMAEYQTGAFILPKPDEERLATEKRIQAWMAENRQRLDNPLAV